MAALILVGDVVLLDFELLLIEQTQLLVLHQLVLLELDGILIGQVLQGVVANVLDIQ